LIGDANQMLKSHQKTIYEALGREPVHPFPARMAPGIALDFLAKGRPGMRVLDPMMGSGTVAAMARAAGHIALGIDIDPLAVLIARVWTVPIHKDEVLQHADTVMNQARRRHARIKASTAYPKGADTETRKFVGYWFDARARRKLTALARSIGAVESEKVRCVLWCAFSRLIITKQAGASLARDLAHSRPHRAYSCAPIDPFEKFLPAVKRVVANCVAAKRGRDMPLDLREGDARDLPFPANSIDLVLTSPPYLNAIDYMRCSKFSLVWMGYSISRLRNLRAESIGTEAAGRPLGDVEVAAVVDSLGLRKKLTRRDTAILSRYVYDLRSSVRETVRVLRPHGRAVYVLGENSIRGTYVRNSAIVTAVAEISGLKLNERRVRTLPENRRYLPPPSKSGAGDKLRIRMRREVVLAFSKR
jgi:SAM-dependent methyltransferase